MPGPLPPARCPAAGGSCPDAPGCHAALPPPGPERAAILVSRFVAAARDTGDACCWDAALDEAEAAFGERQGALVVGCAGALIRRLAGSGVVTFLPPPCRRLSQGEALLLGALRAAPSGQPWTMFEQAAERVAALARTTAPADPPVRRQAA